MLGFFQKTGVKWTFGSTLRAARRNPRAVQVSIARFVQDSLQRINVDVDGKTLAESTQILNSELRKATAERQRLNAAGNTDESNPVYARAALLESALVSISSGDQGLANSVFRDLKAWFSELGLP